MSQFLKREFNILDRSFFNEDQLLDTSKLEKYTGFKLSIGVNKIIFCVNNDIYPFLSKGNLIEIKFDIVLPSNQSDICVYRKKTFEMSGRGFKKNSEAIIEKFLNDLIEKEIIYNYHKENIHSFDESLGTKTLFIDVERTGDFRGKYITLENINFNPNKIAVKLSDLKVSTKEQVYIYNYYKYIDKEPISYMIFNNGLYLNDVNNRCNTYWDFRNYYNNYKGDLNIIVSNIGNWIKIKDINLVEQSDVLYSLDGFNKWSGNLEVESIVTKDKILFSVSPDDLYIENGNDTWYIFYKNDNVINLYKDTNGVNLNIEPIKGEVIFETNITPFNDEFSKFNTSILTSGKYIKADIEIDNEIKTMVLAPVCIFTLSKYNCKQEINVYTFRNHLYGIVGEYEKVGFFLDTSMWNFQKVYVCEIPKNEYSTFYYSYDELLDYLNKIKKLSFDLSSLSFRSYDRKFKGNIFNINVGDIVEVIKEPIEDSMVKGLKCVVEKVSCNKQILEVKFFNLFVYKIPVDCIKKIEE